MGRTPKPLYILAAPDTYHSPEMQALLEQGHHVIEFVTAHEYDVILAPNAWFMNEQHRKYLPLAISEARRRRYPPTKNT